MMCVGSLLSYIQSFIQQFKDMWCWMNVIPRNYGHAVPPASHVIKLQEYGSPPTLKTTGMLQLLHFCALLATLHSGIPWLQYWGWSSQPSQLPPSLGLHLNPWASGAPRSAALSPHWASQSVESHYNHPAGFASLHSILVLSESCPVLLSHYQGWLGEWSAGWQGWGSSRWPRS